MSSKVADANTDGKHVPGESEPAAAGSVALASPKATTWLVTLAGLDPDLENRVKAACWRLGAQGYDIRLRAWSGVRCDLLILGQPDSHGRILEAAKTRRVPVLRLVGNAGEAADAAHVLAPTASVDQILIALRTLLDPAAATSHPTLRATNEKVSGLLWLMLERRPVRAAIHAVSESYEVWLLPETTQIWARTHSDLIGARERLLSPKWVFHRVRAGRVPDGPHQHFDEFFLDACMRMSHRLPIFPRGSYRLRQHIDAPGLVHSPEIAVLAAQFSTRDSVSTADLQAIADVGQHHANAFLWATLASGALETVKMKDASADPQQSSLFERMLATIARATR